MKNTLKVMSSLFMIGLMVSCTSAGSSSTSSAISSQGGSSSVASTSSSSASSSEFTGKTNEDFAKAKTTYTAIVDGQEVEKELNMNTIYKNSDAPHLDPVEPAHVMVVPFGFTDDALQSVQTEENIDRIQKTFFGTDEELAEIPNTWTSVAGYYNQSSYGRANFSGKVLPTWVTYNGTSSQFMSKAGGSLGMTAAEYARNWYNAEYVKPDHGDLGADAEPLSYFDANNDGFIDLLWVVYSHPTGTTEDWWAYVTYSGNAARVGNPTVQTIGFASIDWMKQSCGGYDPHTFIHETGHTYGLDDYYDYTNSWSPMGKVDMMDNNIGDHNAFSKFTLGWASPWVVDLDSKDDTAIITLRSFTKSGDCFIIPSQGYNGTAFDEYIMVELMSPTGLAKNDYTKGYQSITGYSKPGIRLTHVDARVWKGDHDVALTTNPQEGKDFRLCNSKGGRSSFKYESDYFEREDGSKSYMPLISVIESEINAEKNNLTSSSYNCSNNSLFTRGDSFYLDSSKGGWGDIYMPSGSNLWNKAHSIKSWVNDKTFVQEVDDSYTMDYKLKVLSIDTNPEYGHVARVQVTKRA